MFYLLGQHLSGYWGPLRLLNSHLVLLSLGTVLGALAVWFLLPRLWKLLPVDRGKLISADRGMQSVGKPTGAGLVFSLVALPLVLLVVPADHRIYGVLASMYLAMFFGYLDDRSKTAWGEWKKGLLDVLVAVIAAVSLCNLEAVHLWFPFAKDAIVLGPWLFIPMATCILWLSMNATNCSDGVDGLAGSLTLLSLFALGLFLYGVVGYKPIADYLLVPHNPVGAAWAILIFTISGALAGYLWHNAEPSRVLMGDAGSRLLGLVVGAAVLAAGNPFLICVVSPVILLNGGTGLLKLVLLRILTKLGLDTTPPGKVMNGVKPAKKQELLVRTLHRITFPLHDHCRKRLKWSNPQVLLRFVLIQAFLIPLLLITLMKIR